MIYLPRKVLQPILFYYNSVGPTTELEDRDVGLILHVDMILHVDNPNVAAATIGPVQQVLLSGIRTRSMSR